MLQPKLKTFCCVVQNQGSPGFRVLAQDLCPTLSLHPSRWSFHLSAGATQHGPYEHPESGVLHQPRSAHTCHAPQRPWFQGHLENLFWPGQETTMHLLPRRLPTISRVSTTSFLFNVGADSYGHRCCLTDPGTSCQPRASI